MSDLESPYIKAATHIRNSARRMETMINEILDFTRTRLGGGLPMAPASTDLGAVCRSIVDELGACHPNAQLQLTLAGDLIGSWDPSRMEQLLSNLVSNAILHGRNDSPISVSVQGDADEVVVAIHNEGTPISPAQRKSIFDPWRSTAFRDRVQAASARGGLGLGLYICREIAHSHGGSIEVRPDASGNTFTVRLPRKHHAGAEAAGLA